MYIYFQELLISIIIEILRLIEGIYKVYYFLFGSTDIYNNGNKTNIIDKVFNNNEISTIFNCIILISVLIGCVYSVIIIIRNAIKNNNSTSTILSKFVLSILIIFVVSLISLILINISNEGFEILLKIFNINIDIKLSHHILDICSINYNNYYSINEINFNNTNSKILFGDLLYESYQLVPIGWKNNGYINPNTFLYIPCFITSIIVVFTNIYISIILVKRVYELVLLYIIMPIIVFTTTTNNSFKLEYWFSLFIKKLFLIYTIYISMFLFTFIYQYLERIYVHFDTYEFRILNLIFICGGCLFQLMSQKLFAVIFKININKDKVRNIFLNKNKSGDLNENNA